MTSFTFVNCFQLTTYLRNGVLFLYASMTSSSMLPLFQQINQFDNEFKRNENNPFFTLKSPSGFHLLSIRVYLCPIVGLDTEKVELVFKYLIV